MFLWMPPRVNGQVIFCWQTYNIYDALLEPTRAGTFLEKYCHALEISLVMQKNKINSASLGFLYQTNHRNDSKKKQMRLSKKVLLDSEFLFHLFSLAQENKNRFEIMDLLRATRASTIFIRLIRLVRRDEATKTSRL